jgi:hypothetical protein
MSFLNKKYKPVPTPFLLRFRKVGLQIESIGNEDLLHRRVAKAAEEAQRASA